MHQFEGTIEVRVPVTTAYRQWSRFEEFPSFMQGVKEVRRLEEDRLFWRAEIAGHDLEWEAKIIEQILDQRIAWESITGHPNRGVVEFTPVDATRTSVRLVLEYEPLGVAEQIGDALGLVSARIRGDLERFKKFIEGRSASVGSGV
jgi:uncharacterized membrane protein